MTKDIRRLTLADLRGYEAVIHLAELSNDPLGQHRPEATYAINGDGSASLARLAKAAGVRRFLYSSSCSVYGVGTGETKHEESATEPLTAYAACKLRTEAVLESLADEEFSPTSLRNATAYGASPRMRFDIVLNQFAGYAWTKRQIVMNSDGLPWRPLVHVLDIANAFASVLEAPREVVHAQVLNVGSDAENYRVREIAALVAGAFDGCGWTALQGAEQLRTLFAQLRLTGETFEFRAFTRLAQLQHLVAIGELDDQLFWRRAPAAA